MLGHIGFEPEARILEEAITATYTQNVKTKDVGGTAGTEEMAGAIRENLG